MFYASDRSWMCVRIFENTSHWLKIKSNMSRIGPSMTGMFIFIHVSALLSNNHSCKCA